MAAGLVELTGFSHIDYHCALDTGKCQIKLCSREATDVKIFIFNIVKVRLQSRELAARYNGTWNCLVTIVKQEKVCFLLIVTYLPQIALDAKKYSPFITCHST